MTHIQKQLENIYREFKSATHLPGALADSISPPLLLYSGSVWERSSFRVLVVGQETFGWGFSSGDYYSWPYPPIRTLTDFLGTADSVAAMVHAYKVFQFSRQQPLNYRGAFWRAYREIRGHAEGVGEGIETGVLWTNLCRADLRGGSIRYGTSVEQEQIWSAFKGYLAREIQCLKPNAVIFFTGPNYDPFLTTEFPGISIESFGKSNDARCVACVRHELLPSKTFRTYHPTYLNRAGLWSIITEIKERLVDSRGAVA